MDKNPQKELDKLKLKKDLKKRNIKTIYKYIYIYYNKLY